MDKIIYTVQDITGDYALLQRKGGIAEDTILVALALLPLDIHLGTCLLWEDFSYRLLDPEI